MSGLEITEHEHGVVRLFQIDEGPGTESAKLGTRERLERSLGDVSLASEDVQIVDLAMLDGLGLSQLLAEGYDVTLDSAEQQRLDALDGHVALIRSAAFQDPPVTLRLGAEVELIGDYKEGAPPAARFDPLPSGGAEGLLTGAPPATLPATNPRLLLWIVLGVAAIIALVALVAI